MASLYTASNNARKIIVIVLGIFIVIILGDTFLKFSSSLNQTTNNERRFYVDPDRALGDVAAPQIPSIQLDNKDIPIVQESIHPQFPDVSYVYAIEQPREKLNTFENATSTAGTLGFSAEGFQDLGNNDFRWVTADQTKTLNFNKVSQVWAMSTIYENNVNAINAKNILQDIANYESKGASLLNSLGFAQGLGFQGPIVDARYIVRTNQGDITETLNYTEANYIKLNIYRKLAQADLKPQEDQPKLLSGETKPQATTGRVYTSDPRVGEFSAIVSNDLNNLDKDVFEFKFTNFEYGNKGSYFIVTPEEAFTRIQKGQGSLVALSGEGADYFEPYIKLNVTRFIVDARKTELGFYEPEQWTGFVYPIYILSGRAELSDGRLAKFTYFVDAIKRLDS